jgi:hypothetical protein
MAIHDTDIRGAKLTGSSKDVAKQRFARKGLQHLGQLGAHARALACGENDDTEWQGVFLFSGGK